ncbi:TonB-dependent receptor [Phormidesmis sp. 146-33]
MNRKSSYIAASTVRFVGAIAGSLSLVLSAVSAQADSTKVAPSEAQTNSEIAPKPSDNLACQSNQCNVSVNESISKPEIDPANLPANKPASKPANKPVITPSPAATVKILSPSDRAVVDVPAATIVLQFPIGSQVQLSVNGVLADASLIGRTENDVATSLVTQTWYGVALKEGENTVTAAIVGSNQPSTSMTLQVRGAPEKLTLKTVETKIPADGRSTATVQGQLLDQNGNQSNRDAIVTLVSTAGEFVGEDADSAQPGFQVKAQQGQFTAALRSGLESKTVKIRAISDQLEAYVQLSFETNLRPSIATGVIDLRLGKRGTDFYRSFRDYLPSDRDNSTQLQIRSAVFATGRIGDWLFTGAYNSDRPLNQTCDGTTRLFREQQFCDQNYSVYGDSSQSTVITPSTDQVYLRFERTSPQPGAGTDYAMWGDYNTEEFAQRSQEFTAINRQLHGFKTNYNFGNLQATGLYANNVQGFQRDTLAPDGTSGFYFLSRRILVEGSEDIFVELEELNRPGTVVDRQRLNRGTDYEIDYDRGTVLFRNPILRTDISKTGETLVRRLVATYQYDTPGQDTSLYGGRLQYHLSRVQNRESWIGATYLKEDQGTRNFQIYGADAYFSIGSKARLIAEYARSNNTSDLVGTVSGSAYRVELEGEIAQGIAGRAYYRSADTGFANNATVSFTPGQTRYGAQLTAKVSPTTDFRLQYDHEKNQGFAPLPLTTFGDLFEPRSAAVPGAAVNNSLTTISAGIQQKLGAADLSIDWLHRSRTDRLNPSVLNTTSDQLRSRLTVPIAKNLTLLAQNETTLSAEVDSVYSDRSLVGLNWAVLPGVNVQLAQQFFTRGQYEGQSITSLGVSGDYKLGPDTTISARYSILGGANRLTTQGAIGLNQKFTLSPGLRMDLSYEHLFGDFVGTTGAGIQFLQPFAPGQSAASLGVQGGDSYSIGIQYTDSPSLQASARYEHRSNSSGSNTVISAGVVGKISPSLTALVRYQQANASNQLLTGLGDTASLKVGLAYRDPTNDKFNALLRYEYRKNPSTIPDSILFGSGTGSRDHLFALEAIYAPDWRWEFYGKFALRNSTSYLASDLAGTSTAMLAQARATYRLGYKWDLVGEARWINQGSTNFSETGLAIEAGYYLTPNLRLSAGYAFGRVSDRDFDGSRSAGGFYAGLTVKLNELFSGFGQQKVPRPQPEPSQTQPISVVPPSP